MFHVFITYVHLSEIDLKKAQGPYKEKRLRKCVLSGNNLLSESPKNAQISFSSHFK